MESKITLSVDPTDVNQVAAALALFQKLSGTTASTTAGSAVALETKTAKTAVSKTAKTVNVPKQDEPEAEETTTDEDLNGSSQPSVDIDTVRDLVTKKVGANRDAIKAELTKLGAANVPSIKDADLDAFHKFLLKLK